jgi:hypothetical protein
MKLCLPSMLKYESLAPRVRTGIEVDVGVTVGEGVMTAFPVGVTEGVATKAVAAVNVGDAVDAGAQPDSITQRPIAKAGNLRQAFPPLLTEPS